MRLFAAAVARRCLSDPCRPPSSKLVHESQSSAVVDWLSPSLYFERSLPLLLSCLVFLHTSCFGPLPHISPQTLVVFGVLLFVNFTLTDDSRISIFALVRFCRASPPVATSQTLSPLDYSQRRSKENPFLNSDTDFFFSISS